MSVFSSPAQTRSHHTCAHCHLCALTDWRFQMKVGEIGEEDLHSQAQVDGVRVSTHTSLFSDLLQCKNNRSLSKVARGLLTRHFAFFFFSHLEWKYWMFKFLLPLQKKFYCWCWAWKNHHKCPVLKHYKE